MPTHRHVKEALDRAIKAHQNAHRDHLVAAGLEEHTEATVSPGLPEGAYTVDTGLGDE